MGSMCQGQNMRSELQVLGQGHIIRHLDSLKDPEKKQKLLNQLQRANIEETRMFYKGIMNETQIVGEQQQISHSEYEMNKTRRRFRKQTYHPMDRSAIVSSSLIKEVEDELWDIGLEAINNNQVAVILMVGKEYNTLDFFNEISVCDLGIENVTCILDLYFQRLSKVCSTANMQNKFIKVYLMTNQNSQKQFQEFLKEKKYFGYDPASVAFFSQKLNPVIDHEGKIILKSLSEIWEAPAGNGQVYLQILKNRLLQEFLSKEVKYIYLGGTRNILERICDPVKLGYMIKNKKEIVSVCCQNVQPILDENLGILGTTRLRKFKVYEGLDLKQNIGRFYNCGSCYISCQFLAGKLSTSFIASSLATKKHPIIYEKRCYDPSSRLLKKMNGLCFETFYHDLFVFCDDIAFIEVDPKEEFYPLNQVSPQSKKKARETLSNLNKKNRYTKSCASLFQFGE